MNKRIEGLWWKARIGYNNQNCDPEVLEKFAELIVRECADIAAKNQAENMNWDIAEIIKEHFGVEE